MAQNQAIDLQCMNKEKQTFVFIEQFMSTQLNPHTKNKSYLQDVQQLSRGNQRLRKP